MPAATTNTADPYGLGSSAYNLAGNTAASNLAGSGSMIQLADIINATNRAAQTAANNSRLGDAGVATQNNLLTNAQNESQGLLDPQTEQMLQQGIAAQGNASGMGVDSANLAASYRRALGQTINSTEQQAQTNYLALLAANPSAPIYDMSGQLVSPQTYSNTAANQAALAASGGGGASGGGRVGGGNPLTPTAAQANNVPSGGGYAGAGNSAGTWVNAPVGYQQWQQTGDASGIDYSNPFIYTSPSGSTLDWTGLSAGDVGLGDIGSPAYTGTTTGNLGDFGFGDWYQPTAPQQDYSPIVSGDSGGGLTYDDWVNTFGG